MSKYIGKRIVPKHCGEWNRGIPYEMLSIVLHTESGESYISRCEVPAGMDLMDGRYWAVCSRFSQQIKDMEIHLQETEGRMNTNLSETEARMAEDLHSTKAAMSEELGVTAERLNHTVEATKQTLGQRVDEACEDLAEGKKEMESTARRLEARLDANVSASTKPNADYAAELVDLRVTLSGENYDSAGAAVRSEVERLEDRIRDSIDEAANKAKEACIGVNANLAAVFPSAGEAKANGAVREPGKYLAYRITSTTTWGQLYLRYKNTRMGSMRKYLYISKIRVISGNTKGMSCYQYSTEGENLNTHVKAAMNVPAGDYQFVVGYGEVLENTAEFCLSPCVAELDSVIECDSRCVLLDATSYSDEQLNDLFLFLVEPGNYPLSNYESWGPGGIPLYTETAHSAEFAMNANYLTGNRAYHNPSFTALEKNSTALIQSSDTEAWGEVLAKRSADWGTHGGIKLKGLAAGTYLVCARFTEVDAPEDGVGTPGLGVIEPGVPNWATFKNFGKCSLNKLPEQMQILYEYTGEKDCLMFNVQIAGNQFSSFQTVIWVYDVTDLSESERAQILNQKVPEHCSTVRMALSAFHAMNAEAAELADYAEEAGTAENARYAEKTGTAERADYAEKAGSVEKVEYALISGKWKGKKALVIGDSITAARKWQLKLGELLGMDVVTHAKGGIGIVRMVDGDRGLDGEYTDATDAAGVLRPLMAEDVRGIDLIVGLPAYNERAVPYGTVNDLYPAQRTIIGEIQYFINRIYEELEKAENLTCRFLLATPHCAGKYPYVDADGYEEYPPNTGMNMELLSQTITDVAARNNVPVCDLWRESGINRHTWCVFGAQVNPVNDKYAKYELNENGEVIGTTPLRYVSGKSYYQIRDGAAVLEEYTGTSPYPFNGDQLHCNANGYARIGECIVGAVIRSFGI